MGVSLWFLQTLLAGFAGYALAARVADERGILERALCTLAFATASVLAVLYGCGLFSSLSRGPVACVALVLHGALALWASDAGRSPRLRAQLRSDARAPGRLFRDVVARQELTAVALVIAAVAVAASCFIIWRFPSWSWDCVWYHVSMADYAIQTHGNGWVTTHVPYINAYPRDIELLSVWNTLLVGDTRLDDAAQLPFALMGALAVAAFSRRLGATPALSASAGSLWMVTPAVCLQMHTTHADIAAGALFITAVFFLVEAPWSPLARWMTFLVFGLYLGTKVTGLFHLLLVGPLVAFRLGQLFISSPRRKRFAMEVAAQLALCVLLGAFVYVRNLARYHNPFWPVKVVAPFFGELTGTVDPHAMAWPPAFFGAPGALQQMVRQWVTPSENYYPDVREGPFGILFVFLTLPSLCVMTLAGLFTKDRWQYLALAGMGLLAVLVPVAWWGRYTLAMPAAAVIAFAGMHGRLGTRPLKGALWVFALAFGAVALMEHGAFHLPDVLPVTVAACAFFGVALAGSVIPGRYLQVLLSATAAYLAVASYAPAVQGYRVLPTLFASEAQKVMDDARLRKEINWLWPAEAAQARDATFKAGDVIVYDSATSFLGEYWTPDLRNRVEYLEDTGDDAAYLQRLRELHPVWVSAGAGSVGQRVLQSHPELFHYFFRVPASSAVMYRVLGSPESRS